MKTTDPQDEVFPIVNEKDEVIGKITRYEAHKSPNVIHRAIEILVFDKEGRLLIQKRSMTKDTCPGYWSLSVGGHVGYDEEYLPVAIREAHEEIGIVILPESLESLGKIITISPNEKEMNQVYKYVIEGSTTFKPSEDEVDELKFVDLKTLEKMLKTEKWTPTTLQVFKAFL